MEPMEHMDTEDLGTLGQMMALGAEYIAEQDEPGEQATTVPKMENIMSGLADLAQYEATETEPVSETEDD